MIKVKLFGEELEICYKVYICEMHMLLTDPEQN